MANRTIDFAINFKTNTQGLAEARKALESIQNLTYSQVEIISKSSYEDAKKRLNEIYEQTGKIERAMSEAYNPKLGTVNLDLFKQKLQENGMTIESFRQNMSALGPTGEQAFAKMAAGLMNIQQQTVNTTTLFDKLGASLKRNLMTFVSMNVINKVKGSINEAYGYVKNLDTSLNEIRIVTGKSADEMDRFAESSNKAAAKLGKATTDYTKASTIFYQQGLGNEEVQARTDVTLKAANTTGQDTKQVADNLTALWNGFNVGAEEAELYVDRLAALAASTASNLDELTTAMSKNASMAHVMGVSEEQLAAQISTIVSTTRQAPESVGTALKTVYARISDIKAGADEAEISLGNYSGKMAALGINVLDANGNMKDIGATIEEVGENWNNYSKEQQVALAGIMGGQRQVNQLMALFDNWDKYTEAIDTMTTAEGTLQKQQDIYMESAEGQLQKLRTEWEGILDSLLKSDDIIKVAKNISPILKNVERLVDAFGGGIGILQKFSPLLMSVVSPQINAGIAKQIVSFKAQRENIDKTAEATRLYQELFRDRDFTNGFSQQLKTMLGDLVSVRQELSPEEWNQALGSIQNFASNYGKEFEKIAQESRELSVELKDTYGADFGKGLINEKGIFDKQQIEETRKTVQDFQKELNNLTLNPDKFKTDITKIKETFQNTNLPETIQEDLSFVEEYIRTTGDALGEDEINEYIKAWTNATESIPNDLDRIEEHLRNVTIAEHEAAEGGKNVTNSFEPAKIEQVLNSFSSIAQAGMSIFTIFQQIKGLGSIWSDEDLTATEKVEKTLASIVSITTMAAMAFTSLANAKIKESLVTAKETITTALQTAGLIVEKTAAEGATVATYALTAAGIKLMIAFAAIIAIIAAVVIAVKAFEKANETSVEKLKRANEELEETKTKYNELTDAISDYKDAKKGLEKLTEGTQEFMEAITELNSKVLKLIETYPELAQYMEVGQHGELLFNEKGLEKYIELQKEALRLQSQSVIAEGLSTKGDKRKSEKQAVEANGGHFIHSDFFKTLGANTVFDSIIHTEEVEEKWETAAFQYSKLLEQQDKADRAKIAAYLKSYESFADISANTASAIAQDLQNEYKDDVEGLKAAMADEEVMLQRAKEYEKKARNFKNKGFNFTDADISQGDYSSISRADIQSIFRMDRSSLADMLGVKESDKAIDDFLNHVSEAWVEIKNLPSPFESWVKEGSKIDLGIVEKFNKDIKGISDRTLQELGTGLTTLSDKGINIDTFTDKLSSIDWTQGEEGFSEFEQYLKSIGQTFEQLPSEVQNYVKALKTLSSTTKVSANSISNLMGVMSKLSTVKMGDTFSAKDFEEIQSVLEKADIPWRNYFTKIGDKFKYIRADIKDLSKEMDKAFIKKMEEANKEFEGLANIEQNDTSIIRHLGDNVLNSFEGWTAEGAREINEKVINGTATSEEFAAWEDLIKKIREASQNAEAFKEENRKALTSEYIGAYVHSLEELEKKIKEGVILEEDANEYRESILREELSNLDITEEAYEHYADTIKKTAGNENLKDFQIVAKLKLELNGEDYAKQVADAIKDMPDKSASSIAETSSKISLLFSNQLGWDISSVMIGNNLDLIKQILKGSEDAEAQFIENYQQAIIEAGNRGNYKLVNQLQEELNHLKDFFDASKEYTKKSAEEIQQSLIEMAEAQNAHNRKLTQRKIGKTEDRLSHSIGQEYVDNYKILQQQREEEKSYMRESISNKQKLLALVNEEIAKDEDNVELQIKRQSIENEIVDLQNEIVDYDEAQIVDIDKTVDEKRKVAVAQKQLAKLEKESVLLNGDALINNLKKQKKLREEIAETTAAEGKQLVENLKTNQDAVEQMMKEGNIEIDVEYLWDGSIGNYEEIMAKANEVGGDFAERLKELIDKTNEAADALADFAEEVDNAALDALERTKHSKEEHEISENERLNRRDQAIIDAKPNSSEALQAQKNIAERNETNRKIREGILSDDVEQVKAKIDEKYYKDNYNKEKKYLDEEPAKKDLEDKRDEIAKYIDKKKKEGVTKEQLDNDEKYIKLLREEAELTESLNNIQDFNERNDKLTEWLDENTEKYPLAAQGVDKYTHSLEENEKASKKLNAILTEESYVLQNLKDEQSLLYGDDLIANLEEQGRSIQRTVELKKEELELEKQKKKTLEEQQQYRENKGYTQTAKGGLKANLEEAGLSKEQIESLFYEDGTVNKEVWEEFNLEAIPELGEKIKKAYENYTKELETDKQLQEDIDQSTVDIAKGEQEVTKAKKDQLDIDRKIAQEKLKVAEDAIKRDTNANHALAKALLDVDKAIEKVKRQQSDLTGPALIQSMQQEILLQQQKKKILEQQYEQIKAQIQALITLYSLHLSKEYGVSIGFNVDETGVTNIDQLYKAIEGVDSDKKAAAMQDLQNFTSTLNSLASNALSAKKSVDSLGNSIEDLNKKIKETIEAEAFRVKEERWYVEEQELKKIARELSRIEKLQKNLTGDALIKNLTRQQELLDKQAEAQQRKLGIMKAELQTMQTMLALQGVLFTSDGLIANYASVIAKGDEKLNGYMQSYQQFYDQISDLEDSILDTYDKKADLEAEKMKERLRMFNTKIDVELDLTKAKREWQNFKREFLNTLNDMSRLNDSIAEKCKQNVKDIKDMTTKDTVMLTDHVNDIIQEIKIMQAGGTSDLYGVDQATALSDLANYRQQLQDTLSSLADKIKETEEAFLQQLEKIKSKFDDQIGNYETIQSIIEHDMNLIKLLRGDDAYDELANYYDKSTKNYEAELQSLRQQVNYWKALMSEAQPGTEEWEKFQANWKDALNKLNSAVDAAVQNLLDKYKNAINKVISDFEKKITNGSSLDAAKQRWDWQKEEADFYLDEITKIYNIEKLRMKINDAANDEADPAKKARILQIGEKQIKQLESLTKVRQYDVDLANKQLELELKKQELEDAKNQKTSMRLRRDAEGNYRYEYVADQDKIEELRESILDAEQDIYEFTVKNQRDLQDRMYENVKAFEDAIRDLESRRLQMTQDEYEAELQRIKDHFGYMDDAVRSALDKAGSDVTDAAITEAIDLGILFQEQVNQMSDIERKAFAEDIVPTFISAITEMKEIIDGEGGLVAAAKNAFDELDNAFDELEAGLNEIQSAAGVDFDAIIAGIDDTINEMQALIEDNDELLVQYQEELDIIRDLIDELHDLMDAYRDVYDAAMQAIDAALELRETAREAMEEYNDLNSMANDTGGAAANTGTSGGVPAGNYAASKNSISKKGKTNNTESDYITYIDENGEAHTAKLGTNISTSSLQDGKLHSLTVKDSKGNKQTIQHTQILFTGSKDKAQERATGWDTTWGEQNTDTQINDITYKGERADNLKWDEKLKKFVPAFATGGYTGSWGNEGKIAILHEKELVLNQDDTKNILRAVAQVRANTQMGLSPNDFNTLSNMMVGIHNVISDIYAALVNNSANTLMQQAAAASTITSMNSSNVTNNISANFPNAGNMNEIKSAIMGLQNYTSQKIHSNQRVKSTTTPNAYRAKSF